MIAEAVRRAAGRYVAGDSAAAAAEVARRLAARGYTSTICFWDAGGDDPELVVDEYSRALAVVAEAQGYLSVKATAVSFRGDLLDRLADRGVRLHFDAMKPDTVDATRTLIEDLAGERGTTLPGRWRRSDADAEWAVELGLAVRVVKGQWPGPDERDPAAGFLDVVERLAGRARSVSVATHDVELARKALARLRASGTPCELEQLYGLRCAAPPARVYIPYGHAWLPYALNNIRRRPRTAWWLARDLARSSASARRGRSARRLRDGSSGPVSDEGDRVGPPTVRRPA